MSGILTAVAGILPSAAGGASTLFDSINTTGEGQWGFGDGSTNHFYAGHYGFSDASSHSWTEIIVPLTSSGDLTGKTLRIRVWTNLTDNLLTEVGTSDGVAGGAVWTHTEVSFPFSTPFAQAASTTYHITLDTGATDGSNFAAAWYTTPTIISGQLTYFSNVGVNQHVGTFSNHDIQMRIKGT